MRLALSLPASDRPFDVLAVGENSLDVIVVTDTYPEPDSKQPLRQFVQLPGGEAASAAVGVARLGWRAKYIGRFGADEFGTVGRRSLEDEHVDIADVVMVPQVGSRVAVVLVDRATGRRTVLWQRDPALAMEPADVPDDALAQARVVLVGSQDAGAMAAIARRARAAGARTVGDVEQVTPDTAALLAELDVVVMAESFPAAFTGEADPDRALDRLERSTGAAMLCVTRGDRGALARVGGKSVAVPSFPVNVVDTTGAGDLFRAGLIAAWLHAPEGPDVIEMLRYASAVAALNCRALGARSAAPGPAEVDALLRTRPGGAD